MSDELIDLVFELLAYMLLDRAGDKVDDVAQLQRLNAQLLKERAARSDLLTMAEAAQLAGREPKSLRKLLDRQNLVQRDERDRPCVSRKQLVEWLERKAKRPARRRAEANKKPATSSNAPVAPESEKNLASTKST